MMKRSELKTDPEKVKAWQDRSREAARGREGMKSAKARRDPDWDPEKRGPFVRYSGIPASLNRKRRRSRSGGKTWTRRVFARYGTDCLACDLPAAQAHHVTPRHAIMAAFHLTDEQRKRLEYDDTNGMPLCASCHMAHEGGSRRLEFRMIPAPAVDWAIANGFTSRVFDDRIYLGAPGWTQHIEGEAA